MVKKIFVLSIIIVFLLCLIITGCATPAPASKQTPATPSAASPKLVELKAVAGWPVGSDENSLFVDFIDRVNKKAEGQLKINFIGGPESIPTMDQPEAIRSGVIGFNNAAGSYFTTFAPELNALSFVELSAPELRSNGWNNVVNEVAAKKCNVYFLGFGLDEKLQFFMNKRIDTLADFKGLKIRGAPSVSHVIKALGAAPVSMAPGEVYPALERGVIDGYNIGSSHPTGARTYEVLKYAIEPAINRSSIGIWVNLATFNGFSKQLQDLVLASMAEVEKEWGPKWAARTEQQKKDWVKYKMEIITLPPAEAKRLLEITTEENWKMIQQLAPGYDPRLKTLSVKK